ncbi:glycine betaine ABC transporter substrate-binding protein [Peptostreptococcus canis]|uniref:ABC transporter permease subunit n=1 Tax=Peptostreptococcus canis TaxID=1159213 RepID=A0ABR6TIR1_9FIRM|nr:glycine betaine ABC transporter substrate-binding protein [Peptostreptococcus canis]MBC2575312.1 ABC transporter permease subunit [Peptostreptococcus canis]MBP1997505.1 glycine betaine/proline transport system permease protein/glycine betaine/proline transport system substrate-binding protein [Peptostreptococcus canis]
MKNKKIKILLILTIVFSFIFPILFSNPSFSAKKNQEIVFADSGWDSIKLHNAIAGYIASELYGYKWREVPGSSTIMHESLKSGEVDIIMECWTDNIADYKKDKNKNRFKELSINYADNRQGFYVPRYVIEGDKDRNIKPLAPNLKNVWDLEKYASIFKDPEDQSKGRIYGAIPGWEVDSILYKKYKHYKLDNTFNYFRPGSDSALSAALTSAYDKGEPIVSYYWEPTWLMGKYDFILLQDKPYTEEGNRNGETELPSVKVTVATSNKFFDNNKELVTFLKKYKTSSDLTSEALAHMQETKEDYNKTAKWFLSKHPELLDQWLNKKDAEKIKKSISKNATNPFSSFLYDFPIKTSFDISNIDNSVRNFSVKHKTFFDAIRNSLMNLVSFIQGILNLIPWPLFMIIVYISAYKSSKKHGSSLLYVFFLSLIGVFGLWGHMNETLAIVIASVLISLLFGFPIGVLVSTSDRLNSIIRPILDTMQTMPVFVYLIPALLFFGLGKAPAVIATTIYAIVPTIRMTSHGIRQIDIDVIEATQSFGSTKIQSLVKVEIPQALPTIMTGVNQTIMMAMSMVVTTSMIGATGLGMEVLISVNRVEIGRGLVSGTAVVIIAIILDRITQGMVKGEVKK